MRRRCDRCQSLTHHDDPFSVVAITDTAGSELEKIECLDFGQPIITGASLSGV